MALAAADSLQLRGNTPVQDDTLLLGDQALNALISFHGPGHPNPLLLRQAKSPFHKRPATRQNAGMRANWSPFPALVLFKVLEGCQQFAGGLFIHCISQLWPVHDYRRDRIAPLNQYIHRHSPRPKRLCATEIHLQDPQYIMMFTAKRGINLPHRRPFYLKMTGQASRIHQGIPSRPFETGEQRNRKDLESDRVRKSCWTQDYFDMLF